MNPNIWRGWTKLVWKFLYRFPSASFPPDNLLRWENYIWFFFTICNLIRSYGCNFFISVRHIQTDCSSLGSGDCVIVQLQLQWLTHLLSVPLRISCICLPYPHIHNRWRHYNCQTSRIDGTTIIGIIPNRYDQMFDICSINNITVLMTPTLICLTYWQRVCQWFERICLLL